MFLELLDEENEGGEERAAYSQVADRGSHEQCALCHVSDGVNVMLSIDVSADLKQVACQHGRASIRLERAVIECAEVSHLLDRLQT